VVRAVNRLPDLTFLMAAAALILSIIALVTK